MKTPNQAEVKASKRKFSAPSQKQRTHQPEAAIGGQALGDLCRTALSIARRGRVAIPIIPPMELGKSELVDLHDPFQQNDSFEINLDWIGDTMEPEVFQGDRAMITRREEMYPCAGELVVGLFSTGRHAGRLVFGAHEFESPGLCRITFINPKYVPVYYPEKKFKWLYPVYFITQMDREAQQYRKVLKTIEFHLGDE
jgi:hypothetical protein